MPIAPPSSAAGKGRAVKFAAVFAIVVAASVLVAAVVRYGRQPRNHSPSHIVLENHDPAPPPADPGVLRVCADCRRGKGLTEDRECFLSSSVILTKHGLVTRVVPAGK
jgi:hypothetical protein